MATNLTKLLKSLPTKKDLNRLATKADLKKLATKDQLLAVRKEVWEVNDDVEC